MSEISDKEFYEVLKSRLDKLDKKESDLLSQLDKVESDQKAIAILLNGYVPTDAPVKINQVQEKLLKKDDFNTWGDYIFAVFMKVGGVGTVHPVVEYILEVHPDFDREYVRKSATNSMSTLAKRGKLSVRKDKKSRRFIYQLIDAKP